MPNIYRFQQNDIVNDTQKVGTSTFSNNKNNLTGIIYYIYYTMLIK